MPGFCLMSSSSRELKSSLRLFDLGGSDIVGSWHSDSIAVAWTYWNDHPQFHLWRRPDRLLWIEGQPDRLPNEAEPILSWLQGRWGSFRGVEVSIATDKSVVITAFVDPLATRPLYFLEAPGTVLIADKLATIAANQNCDLEWAPMFELMCLGAVCSGGVSLQNAAALRPGQVMEFRQNRRKLRETHSQPQDPDIKAGDVRESPAKALLHAHEKAVLETWTNPEGFLLLSGGLDSRFALSLAGRKRKTLNVTTKPNQESSLAQQIAKACDAEFVHWNRPYGLYYGILRETPLLTGALADSQSAQHLGLGTEWRFQGIHSVANAFLYDTLLKAWFTIIDQPYPSLNPILESAVGERESIFQKRSGRSSYVAADDALSMLSEEGRSIALAHLQAISDVHFPIVRSEGLNLTLERAVLSFVSRQTHYPLLLGWMEEQAVSSPIFHPALWTWYQHSSPNDRKNGKAFRDAILLHNHPSSKIVDSNTGAPITRESSGWRDLVRRVPLYTALRKLRYQVKSANRTKLSPTPRSDEPPVESGSWPHIVWICRTKGGREVIEQGVEYLQGHPYFDMVRITKAIDRFQNGEDDLLEPVLSMMTMGRWKAYVGEGPASQQPHLKTVPIEKSA